MLGILKVISSLFILEVPSLNLLGFRFMGIHHSKLNVKEAESSCINSSLRPSTSTEINL